MDCSIVPMKRHGLSMISTCDFFYPLVDDPFTQGRIGACNVLSDMYALGVVEIDSVLMILASSKNIADSDVRDTVTRSLIEGFNCMSLLLSFSTSPYHLILLVTCNQAGVECTGGQSVVC